MEIKENIKFPCCVRRVRILVRNGEWQIDSDVVIPSMTLPRHTKLPAAGQKRGVSGFWLEVQDENGTTLYRTPAQNPFQYAVELFERDGRPRRVLEKGKYEYIFEILIPNMPQMASVAFFSDITEEGERLAGARELYRMPIKAKSEGGEYGRS